MPTATSVPESISSLKAPEEKFDKILSENQDLINKITPFNPVISKDDEWNDPIYDSFAQRFT